MEHHVIIEKLCSCAKKEGFSQIETFDAKTDALEAAEAQVAFMQAGFCGKHSFDVTEVDDHYVIGMVGGGCGCGTHDKH
jgi:hypothetical protein